MSCDGSLPEPFFQPLPDPVFFKLRKLVEFGLLTELAQVPVPFGKASTPFTKKQMQGQPNPLRKRRFLILALMANGYSFFT